MVSPRIKKCTLLMSCRCIIGQENNLPLRTGVYGNGSLVVVSDISEQEGGPFVKVPEILDLLWDKDIEEVFVYLAGISLSMDTLKKRREFEATMVLLKLALDLVDNKDSVRLVGCSCNWGKKEILAKEMGLELIQSECGGSKVLGEIAAEVLEKVTV